MSLHRPYDPDHPLFARCSCGADHRPADHPLDQPSGQPVGEPDGRSDTARLPAVAAAAHPATVSSVALAEQQSSNFLESVVLKALMPHEPTRRRFLGGVGAATAMGAIASLFPLDSLQAMAMEAGPLEKKDLKLGFIAITCAAPLVMAEPLGFYKQQGLNVTLNKTAGWALIRDKMLSREHDASHFLSPMPLAISMGLGAPQTPMRVAAIQNTNGQAITLALKHKDRRDPASWKGFKFAVPFEYSMHNFLLRYYLAEHGIDPDRDVQIRVTPPPEMVANLRAGNIDGFLGPDPFNQRAVYDEVGFIHILSRDIWDGHPCCGFGVHADFIQQNPNTFAALYRAVLQGCVLAHDPKNRTTIAKAIAPANYLNQPETVLDQVLTGRFADGLGGVKNVPDRVTYDPVPWYSMATWILTQMKRWGYIKGDVNYNDLAEQVFLLTDARKHMAEVGLAIPSDARTGYRHFSVMGKEFDPAKAAAYANSFAIRKS